MKTQNKLYWIFVLAILTVAALACGSGSGSSSGPGATTFAKVCSSGEGADHDAYYGSAADGAGPFPVMVFRQTDKGSWLRLQPADLGDDFPSDWHPAESKLTELVVCLTVIEREAAYECAYTETGDENEEVELTIELQNTTYEAVLYNAATAEEYDTITFTAMSEGECPETAIESVDDTRMLDANPAAKLVPFLKPWVEIKE
jgi:hypothetical protein